jgi:hypothetical protein
MHGIVWETMACIQLLRFNFDSYTMLKKLLSSILNWIGIGLDKLHHPFYSKDYIKNNYLLRFTP